jgi:pimeloyl-ACP methyl ester carboxylesterase
METTEVGGLRISYERAGTGPPLVLLHGYVGDARATWHHQLDDLSDEFTVIAWDAPGAGGSSDPPESFGTAGYADALAGFVAALGLDTPHVVGLSFGGILALALYRRHPGVARTLTLASAYAGWYGSLPAKVAGQRLRQAMALADLPPEEFAGILLPTIFREGAPAETLAPFAASVRAFHPAGYRAMARASAENLRDVLPKVEVPTLLVYGAEDVRAPLPVAKDLEASIPASTLVVLDGAGHACNLEAPDEFNRVVRSFLRG